jgi:hypothetical protein
VTVAEGVPLPICLSVGERQLHARADHNSEAGASTFMWLFVLVIFVLGMWTTWSGISTAVADRGERHSLCLKVADSPSAKAQMGC